MPGTFKNLNVGDTVEIIKMRDQEDFKCGFDEGILGKQFKIESIMIKDGMPQITIEGAPTGLIWPLRCIKKIKAGAGHT